RRARRRNRSGRVKRQADQTPGNASVTAVLDAHDNFLPHVAALAPRDCAILEARLEWNRLRVHIDAEARAAALDPYELRVSLACADAASRNQRRGNRLRVHGIQKDVVARNPEL